MLDLVAHLQTYTDLFTQEAVAEYFIRYQNYLPQKANKIGRIASMVEAILRYCQKPLCREELLTVLNLVGALEDYPCSRQEFAISSRDIITTLLPLMVQWQYVLEVSEGLYTRANSQALI